MPFAAVDVDDPTPVEHQGSSSKVFVRNLFTDFPTGFDQQVRQHQGSPTFALFKAERPLLIQLLGASLPSPSRTAGLLSSFSQITSNATTRTSSSATTSASSTSTFFSTGCAS
jgi:hypothetical protein